MINMMYLVLIAMLALNLDSAVIQKFLLLNNSLETANAELLNRNQKALEAIKAMVEERNSRPEELEIVQAAEKVRGKTKSLVSFIETIKDELYGITGRDENGNPKSPEEITKTEEFMLGGNKKGKGYLLKKELDKYTEFLKQISGSSVKTLTADASQVSVFKKDEAQRNKDFAQLQFEQTPLAAALALLSEKQAEVLRAESAALSELANKVGALDFKFDQLSAMYSAETNIVAAGTKYRAKMFLTATSSSVRPYMTFNGSPVKVDANGIGTVEFTASSGDYDASGLAKRQWQGRITLPSPSGRGDTTFTVTGEYYIAKPVIQVQSTSVKSLYLNCGNEMDIQVPALGAAYNPSFSISGGTLLQGSKRGSIIVIPTSPEVTLTVSSDGYVIGTEKFKVKRVPKPQIKLYSGSGEIDMKRGMTAPGPRSISVRVVPDESFREFLPKEARYRVSSCDVILARGKRAVLRQSFGSGDNIGLGSILAQAQPGDRIVVEVKSIQRKNFRDQVEDVAVGGGYVATIPLN